MSEQSTDTQPQASAAAAPTDAAAAPRDPFDPFGWQVPAICKDCGKQFEVPYRHFQVGVVFHCPHCHGSYVPKASMYRQVRDAFEAFYGGMKRQRDELARSGGDMAAFQRKFETEAAAFHERLELMAREMRPAGKLVRPKGIRAMFT